MSEPAESEPTPSSSENPLAEEIKDVDEPLSKKRKVNESDRLEYRLGGILCCAVCLDLPQAAVYQCSNGHLMCAPCFTHLLADARLRDESATCPNCRVEISKASASRNLAVEKTVSELPLECKYCSCVFPRHSLQHHEEKQCEDRDYKFTQIVLNSGPKRPYLDGLVRIVTSVYALVMSAFRRSYLLSEVSGARRRYRRLTGCKYACIGCPWRGPAHEVPAHETRCTHPHRSAGELLDTLADRDRRAREEHLLYNQLIDLLSYEKITFTGLKHSHVQLKPYRTEEYVHKLYYESSRFPAFAQQWVVKAYVNKNQRDPTQSTDRTITYQVACVRNVCPAVLGRRVWCMYVCRQLILKSKGWGSPAVVQWVVTRGPWGEARLEPRVSSHTFREEDPEAPAHPLPLADSEDANRLLATKAIHFRLIMFLASK